MGRLDLIHVKKAKNITKNRKAQPSELGLTIWNIGREDWIWTKFSPFS